MRDLNELNINEGGRPVTRPQPNSEQLAVVENLVAARLPALYVALLMFSNGGHPEVDTFYFEAEGMRQELGISRFFHVSSDIESTENVVWNYTHRWSGAQREVLPIADDGGGNLICLDLTETGNEKVVLWVHDPPQPLLSVADSFEALIDSLVMNPDYI